MEKIDDLSSDCAVRGLREVGLRSQGAVLYLGYASVGVYMPIQSDLGLDAEILCRLGIG